MLSIPYVRIGSIPVSNGFIVKCVETLPDVADAYLINYLIVKIALRVSFDLSFLTNLNSRCLRFLQLNICRMCQMELDDPCKWGMAGISCASHRENSTPSLFDQDNQLPSICILLQTCYAFL